MRVSSCFLVVLVATLLLVQLGHASDSTATLLSTLTAAEVVPASDAQAQGSASVVWDVDQGKLTFDIQHNVVGVTRVSIHQGQAGDVTPTPLFIIEADDNDDFDSPIQLSGSVSKSEWESRIIPLLSSDTYLQIVNAEGGIRGQLIVNRVSKGGEFTGILNGRQATPPNLLINTGTLEFSFEQKNLELDYDLEWETSSPDVNSIVLTVNNVQYPLDATKARDGISKGTIVINQADVSALLQSTAVVTLNNGVQGQSFIAGRVFLVEVPESNSNSSLDALAVFGIILSVMVVGGILAAGTWYYFQHRNRPDASEMSDHRQPMVGSQGEYVRHSDAFTESDYVSPRSSSFGGAGGGQSMGSYASPSSAPVSSFAYADLHQNDERTDPAMDDHHDDHDDHEDDENRSTVSLDDDSVHSSSTPLSPEISDL
mmetsp:Transcript_40863/g.102906  ORF Transcript_40863/g.102906 Transcript_40863/m.102906 type:complete len:427 (+) Transcript_40863:113-1393(+)|eukprot:CAMPEP_0174232100 /NCGR_PEP_ID=MMETSP0417-20130205/2475_1 /TAXON_ID=242541 /ORGANISM="Mayorella sp, Strain BSH-02190019" /LENGTH=426 /DNA_ID=CAMNT_0015310093 /DNA_START=97 /DNA_END=1377 /DNA_ORIENTATION=+